MGVARLLAKGWVLFCVYAGAHALVFALGTATPLLTVLQIVVCVILFAAMGLLFIGGYGASAGAVGTTILSRLKPRHLTPGFNELVFMIFVFASFLVQTSYAAALLNTPVGDALEGAIGFVVPGQKALSDILGGCTVDGGRLLASAFAWFLALIYLCSALSRIRLSAGLLRLERKERPEVRGDAMHTLVLGIAAVIGIQFLYVGTAYTLLDCTGLTGLQGQILSGIGPLMLAYLMVAALTSLMALSPEAKN